jgi:hypothetical protein
VRTTWPVARAKPNKPAAAKPAINA